MVFLSSMTRLTLPFVKKTYNTLLSKANWRYPGNSGSYFGKEYSRYLKNSANEQIKVHCV